MRDNFALQLHAVERLKQSETRCYYRTRNRAGIKLTQMATLKFFLPHRSDPLTDYHEITR